MKLTSFLLFFLIGGAAWGQQSYDRKSERQSADEHFVSFENYCKQYAATVLELPEEKQHSFPVAGEVDMPSVKQPSYLDFGVELQEEATRYFTIRNTNKVLKVESLYRLRLEYTLSQQKL